MFSSFSMLASPVSPSPEHVPKWQQMRIDKILVKCKLPRENFIKIMLCEALEGDPLTIMYEFSFFLDVNYERHELDTSTLARGL